MNRIQSTPADLSVRRHSLWGGFVVLLLGGVGGWATMTELAGAVVLQGIGVEDLGPHPFHR